MLTFFLSNVRDSKLCCTNKIDYKAAKKILKFNFIKF